MTKPVHRHSSSTVRDYPTAMRAAAWGQTPFPKGLQKGFPDPQLRCPRLPSAPGHKRPRDGSFSTAQAVGILLRSVRNTQSLPASHLPLFWVQDPSITFGTTLPPL